MSAVGWAWLITAAVSILLGWLEVKFDKQQKAMAYLVALVVAGIGSTVALYFELQQSRAEEVSLLARAVPTLRSPVWNAVVQDIAQYDREDQGSPLEDTLIDPLRQTIARSISEAREGLIVIPDKRDAVVVTLKLIEKAQRSVRATSYINPREWWESDIGPDYDEQSKARRPHVTQFQRLFIAGSTEEARRLKPIMDAQVKAGIEVKVVCASSIPVDQREDFIVVDTSVAAALVLNQRREFRSSQFFSTKTRAEDFDRRFSSLWVGGKRPNEFGQLACATSSDQ